eukprot:scaffold678949_cov45-Prasinocladus_malaysianus.AAC.1
MDTTGWFVESAAPVAQHAVGWLEKTAKEILLDGEHTISIPMGSQGSSSGRLNRLEIVLGQTRAKPQA